MADLNEILKQVTTELTGTYQPDYTKIEEQRAAEQKALDAERNRQQGILDKNLFNANQQAYTTRMQAQRDMPSQLAAQGIKGGATETTINNLYNNYLNARNAAKASYDESTGSLSSNYNTNLASLGSKYAQMMAALDSEKRNQALTLAQQKYQQALAEEERQRQEAEAAAAAARSYGGGGGYGSGGDDGYDPYKQRRKTEEASKQKGLDPYAWQNRSYGSTDKYAWQNRSYGGSNKTLGSSTGKRGTVSKKW